MPNQQIQSSSNKNQSPQSNKGMRPQANSRSPDSQQMDTDYDRQNERPVRASSGKQEGQKSIGEVISQSLSKSGQESIDRTISQVSDYFKTAKTYVSENPRESALIAASAGLAAYVLLTTKPGRKVFDAGMALAGPELTKMFSGSTERGEKAQ